MSNADRMHVQSTGVAKTPGMTMDIRDENFWEALPVGMSVGVAVNEGYKFTTLRSYAFDKARQLERRFKVIDWKEKGFEIARLPDGVEGYTRGFIASTDLARDPQSESLLADPQWHMMEIGQIWQIERETAKCKLQTIRNYATIVPTRDYKRQIEEGVEKPIAKSFKVKAKGDWIYIERVA